MGASRRRRRANEGQRATLGEKARFWDAEYASADDVCGAEPDARLASRARLLRPGMRVAGSGQRRGRNSGWPAGQGPEITAVDGSARALAGTRGVEVARIAAGLRNWGWPRACFDRVIAILAPFRPTDRPVVHRRMPTAPAARRDEELAPAWR